jgi:hypothetical protein
MEAGRAQLAVRGSVRERQELQLEGAAGSVGAPAPAVSQQ